MGKGAFNRIKGDVGNILAMEHVNVTVPDQGLATLFYVNGLGLTRDPYIDFGTFNVWINAGRQQFHLPTAEAQVLRGRTGLVVPDLQSLSRRLARITGRLEGTRFGFTERRQFTDVTCPWGNQIRCHAPGRFGNMQLGIPYVEFTVPTGTASGIAAFYSEVMGCRTRTTARQCEVFVGQGQVLRFRESTRANQHYDGHHIAIYIADFSGPHTWLDRAGLISEESDECQYRFQHIVDPSSGRLLFEIEHEVRSLFHPMWERHLVNRNAEQSFFHYQKDRDAFTPGKLPTG